MPVADNQLHILESLGLTSTVDEHSRSLLVHVREKGNNTEPHRPWLDEDGLAPSFDFLGKNEGLPSVGIFWQRSLFMDPIDLGLAEEDGLVSIEDLTWVLEPSTLCPSWPGSWLDFVELSLSDKRRSEKVSTHLGWPWTDALAVASNVLKTSTVNRRALRGSFTRLLGDHADITESDVCQLNPEMDDLLRIFEARLTLAEYFREEINVLVALATGRNYPAILHLTKTFSFQMLVGLCANQRLPYTIRAAFCELVRVLFVDRYPQSPWCGRPNMPQREFLSEIMRPLHFSSLLPCIRRCLVVSARHQG